MLQIWFTVEQLSKSVLNILLIIIVYLTVNNWFVMIYNKPYLETLLPRNFSFVCLDVDGWFWIFCLVLWAVCLFFLIIIECLVYFYIVHTI